MGQKVVEALGFGSDAKTRKPHLNDHEVAAAAEMLRLKAASMWLEDTPRTTIREVAHDAIPTGPPVCTPPHNLSKSDDIWVDGKIEAEVQRGQLIRGNSPWGSPPFPTKENADNHKKQRKRRLVVDYRRVNARVSRSVYYVKRVGDVVLQAIGSVFYTFLDACTGFNQVMNTRRAREILALAAKSGKFLPVCLTFGPNNGPDDFAYVVDRCYAPGRGRRMRLGCQIDTHRETLAVNGQRRTFNQPRRGPSGKWQLWINHGTFQTYHA